MSLEKTTSDFYLQVIKDVLHSFSFPKSGYGKKFYRGAFQNIFHTQDLIRFMQGTSGFPNYHPREQFTEEEIDKVIDSVNLVLCNLPEVESIDSDCTWRLLTN